MIEVKTHTEQINDFYYTITQEYDRHFRFGHYKWCVTDKFNSVVLVGQTIKAYKGVIGIDIAQKINDCHIHELTRWSKILKGEKVTY